MPKFDPVNLAAWCGGRWTVLPGAGIEAVQTDSRIIQPGDLFVALRGPRHDGHDHVAAAFGRGAAGAVVSEERAGALVGSGPLLIVSDPPAALREMARGYRATLSAEMMAVTGSVGKTTVKEMAAAVLSKVALTAKTLGNYNNDIGLPLSLLAAPSGARFGVFEVGMNHPGELRPLCELLRPKWGMVTNIGAVHIEFFQSLEDIAREKAEVVRCLPPDGVAVLDADSPFFPLLKSETRARIVTVALTGDADYQGEVLDVAEGWFAVKETSGGSRVELRVSVPGRHAVSNALYAVAVGRRCGMSWEAIAAALAEYRPLSMRWNVSDRGGVTVINDAYNANPISMKAALETFAAQPVAGRRWLVLGGMRELGLREQEEHEVLGRRVAAGGWHGLVAVGPLARRIAEAARRNGMPAEQVWICEKHEEAAEVLRRHTQPGDAVLLKGSRSEAVEKVLDYWQAGG